MIYPNSDITTTTGLVYAKGTGNCLAMELRSDPRSEGAQRLTRLLSAEIASGVGSKPLTKKQTLALGHAVADLLEGASFNPPRPCYRPMARSDFNGMTVGFRPFKTVIEALEVRGYVQRAKGWRKLGLVGTRGIVTRYQATVRLIDVAARVGVLVNEWSKHYCRAPSPSRVRVPVILRAGSTVAYGRKAMGPSMPIDPADPGAMKVAEQVQGLNRFFANVRISPSNHLGFHRIFNQGDHKDFAWNKGGRLYAIGGGYQNMKKEQRRSIRINGEATVEIDITSSHVTILHALAGVRHHPSYDPYEIDGLPRHVVKSWITMTLGYDRFQTRWSTDAKATHARRVPGGNLQKEYPIARTRETILRHLPILADWPHSSIRWGDLQFLESEAVIDAVCVLAEAGIPAFPVHDSIILPVSKAEDGKEALIGSFRRHFGIKPGLKVTKSVICESMIHV